MTAGLVEQWQQRMQETHVRQLNQNDKPNDWSDSPQSLVTISDVKAFHLGTGAAIYDGIKESIDTAQQEVLLVTCFWARSRTLDTLNGCLRKLSSNGQQSGRKIRVRLCFSSSSLFQKLSHTSSLRGKEWPSSSWVSKLGLPHPDDLPGLDLQVKSIFVLPLSVMHPKFIVVDRRVAFLPSCNVSWEDWLEGCVEMTGPVVEQFVKFWHSFWGSGSTVGSLADSGRMPNETATGSSAATDLLFSQKAELDNIDSIFLPSPHHRNPHFTWPWQTCGPAPPTPLNEFLLTALTNAKSNIYVQTPNLTSPPVLSVLLAALKRGVDVSIVTSERLMILEQLVTAGRTTTFCMKLLVKRHRKLYHQDRRTHGELGLLDLEAGRPADIGDLRISYFKPSRRRSTSRPDHAEPLQSHLKLTMIDDEVVVLGSGNMDRASWFTSQELGVAFISKEMAKLVNAGVIKTMERRSKLCYSSTPR